MNEVLVPYTDYDTDALANEAHELVRANRKHLYRRRLLGVIARYGKDIELAKAKIEKGQRETLNRELRHFVVTRSTDGAVRGMAAIFPNLPLIRTCLPINPRFLPNKMQRDFEHANPNISAWEADNDKDLLKAAYSELRGKTHQFIPVSGVRNIAWTIEPNKAPHYIHRAITESGMERINTGLYYDGESRLVVGPSVLYAATSGHFTAGGRLRELSSGDWHGSEDELMSRNPRGV